MRLKKIGSEKLIWVNINKFRVKWDKPCRSKFQFEVKQFFKQYWQNQIVVEEFPVTGSLMKCDLINLTKNIVVESDGDQHQKFNPHFHHKSRLNYLNQIKRDVKKEEWAKSNGFIFVEIYPTDLPLTKDFFSQKYGIFL